MKVAVTGTSGQAALSLRERAAAHGIDVAFVGRPVFDFENLETIGPALRAARPDLVVNAAAFTAVDLAENDEATATRVNGDAAREAAAQAARSIFRPTVCSTAPRSSLSRGGHGRADKRLLASEIAVATATGNQVILRTAWIYSPFGKNFVRTMLALGCNRRAVSVVADQIGTPSYAANIADGILAIADSLAEAPKDASLRGIFHLAGQDAATWTGLAEATFQAAEARGRARVRVERITSADYPTPARRPANLKLDCAKLHLRYGVALPYWRQSVKLCVDRLLQGEAKG